MARMRWQGEVAEVPDAEVEHYRGLGAQLLPTPEQSAMRRQGIEADRAGYEAEAAGLESQALRELLASGAGAAASLLIPGGPAVRAGMAAPELLAALAARSGLGALGGAAGGGVEAGISGDEVLPAMGRGAAMGGLMAPGMTMAGRAAGDLGSAMGRVAVGGARRLEKFADAPVVRRLWGMGRVRNMAGDVVEVADRKAARQAAAALPQASPAAAAPPPAPPSPSARLDAMKPLRANASREATHRHLVEAEQAMAELKLDAAAKRRILASLGHGEPAKGAAQGRVVGKIEPAPKPASGAAPAKGTAESRVLKMPEKPTAPKHVIDVYLKGEAKRLDVSKMTPQQIETGIAEKSASVARVGAKRAQVAQAELDALRSEKAYRASQAPKEAGREAYQSSSQGDVDPGSMHPSHLRAAINKKGREVAAGAGAEAKAQLDLLNRELKHRMSTQAEHTAY